MKSGGQARTLIVLLTALYAGVALVLTTVMAAAAAVDQEVIHALRDPIIVLGGRFGTGVVSNLGVVLWCWAAAAAVLAGAVLLRTGRAAGRALLAVGLLTVVFGLDDLFMGHELFAQKLGIPEPATYGAYGAAALGIGFIYREYWRRTEFLLVLPVAVFFTLSVLADVAETGTYTIEVLEDCAKFAGIGTWALYLVRTAYLELVAELRTPASA